MTPVSFVKTTESYEVSLVIINRQTSYDSGILRQDYGIIRSLPMNHMSHHLVSTFTGKKRAVLITASDWTERAAQSCNNWLEVVVLPYFDEEISYDR